MLVELSAQIQKVSVITMIEVCCVTQSNPGQRLRGIRTAAAQRNGRHGGPFDASNCGISSARWYAGRLSRPGLLRSPNHRGRRFTADYRPLATLWHYLS